MTVVPPLLPGVVTRSRNASAAVTSPLPAAKRSRVAMKETTTPSISQQPTCSASANSNLEQWLADVSNVDISLSVSLGSHPAADATTSEQSISPQSSDHLNAASSSSACLSIPDLLTRLLQTKLAIDPARLTTMIKDPSTLRDASVFVALAVKGREEPIQDAIEGGLTPRKAFLRSAPHISRVASRLQDCIRQIFGIDDFVVKVD